MTLPLSLGTLPLPDWLPGWLSVVLLIPIVLWLLAAIAMPFAILGTRSRLEALEAQLDDMHAELRNLAVRLGPVDSGYDGGFEPPVRAAAPARPDPRQERPRVVTAGPPVGLRAEPRFGPRLGDR